MRILFISESMEQGATLRSRKPKFTTAHPNYQILSKCRSRFTHYYFYIRDPALGALVIRVASFLPFHTTYWLNGHNFIRDRTETTAESSSAKMTTLFFPFPTQRKAPQAAADRLSPELIRQRLDYWTFLLGPQFSEQERKAIKTYIAFTPSAKSSTAATSSLSATSRSETSFERSCELGLLLLRARLTKSRSSSVAP